MESCGTEKELDILSNSDDLEAPILDFYEFHPVAGTDTETRPWGW